MGLLEKAYLLNHPPIFHSPSRVRGWDFGGYWYHGAPKPRGNEDLTLAHLLVVGAAAPASVDLLYECGQLLDSKASLLLQVEKLRSGERGNGEAGLGEQCSLFLHPTVPEASQPVFYLIIPLSSEFIHLFTNSC